MTLLQHQELLIVKGVGPTPGDTASAEQPLTVVNLMDADAGFSLANWSPNIPSLKSGGVWADSNITDGRVLISGVNTNVVETIVINLTGSTVQDYAFQFAKLQRLIQDCHDFWDTFNQIEPIYLRWWGNCAPGPQFSLVYSIDMDIEFDDSAVASSKITLKIEREQRWTAIRPGGNPKEWTYYSRNQLATFKASVASLITGTDHLAVNTSLNNERAWANSSFTAISNLNYIDIPANSIPGDLPALCCIEAEITTSTSNSLLVAVSSKPTSLTRRDGSTQFVPLILNAGDSATLIADTTVVADTGSSLNKSAVRQRVRCTFATSAAMSTRFAFSPTSAGVDLSAMRGRYAVFLRARVSAAATVLLQFQISSSGGAIIYYTSPQATLTDLGTGGTGNSSAWALVYIGQVSLPVFSRTLVDPLGRGIQSPTLASVTELLINIQASRTSGAGELYVCDLILWPIDESSVNIIPNGQGTGVLSGFPILVDNTRYSSHGRDETISTVQAVASGESEFDGNCELRGSPITLNPNNNNRIFFLSYNSGNNRSYPQDTTGARINIIPCWSSIRDK